VCPSAFRERPVAAFRPHAVVLRASHPDIARVLSRFWCAPTWDFTLSLLLARSSLSFLPFGATKIAPVRFFPADRSLLEAGVFNFEHPKWNFFANSA
jgi:hypothetical protein